MRAIGSRERRRAQAAERLLAQADAVAAWYDERSADDLAAPTILSGWDVRDLGAHCLVVLTGLTSALGRPSVSRPLPQHVYLTAYREFAAQIEKEAQDRAVGTPDLSTALRTAVTELGVRLGCPWPEVVTGPRGPVRADDFVTSRVIDLVVHSDDLGRSGPPGPAIDRQALAAATRGAAAVLADRYPGATIEVRMPPAAAVQCGVAPVGPSSGYDGSTHTRGTPPNVVEMAPMIFLRLATGRLSWASALLDASVRASGAHADLSALLPLFG